MLKKLTKLDLIIDALNTPDIGQCHDTLAWTVNGKLTVCAVGKIALALGLREQLEILGKPRIPNDDRAQIDKAMSTCNDAARMALVKAGFVDGDRVRRIIVDCNDNYGMSFAEIARVLVWLHGQSDHNRALEILEAQNTSPDPGAAIWDLLDRGVTV